MKLAALLSRAKGRDFYDVMILMAQTEPDFDFLARRCGINKMDELKEALLALLERIDLSHKLRDVEHLLFNHHSSQRILNFPDFVAALPELARDELARDREENLYGGRDLPPL